MKKMSFLLVIFLSGCAHTNIDSLTDPAYRNKFFEHILVLPNIRDIAIAKNVEESYLSSFWDKGIDAISGLSLIPPTRDYSADELKSVCTAHGVDAILFVTIDAAGSTSEYVHLGSTPSKTTTTGRAEVVGNGLNYSENSETSPGREIGVDLDKFWASHSVSLIDASNLAVAWIATSHTSGTAYASFSTLMGSQASAAVEKLTEDRIVQIDKQPLPSWLSSSYLPDNSDGFETTGDFYAVAHEDASGACSLTRVSVQDDQVVKLQHDAQPTDNLVQAEIVIQDGFILKVVPMKHPSYEIRGSGMGWGNFTYRRFKRTEENNKGKVGINLDSDGKISSVADGSPAAQAGIKVGDSLMTIDGTPISLQDIHSVIAMIRGVPGTTVKVQVLRKNVVMDFILTRRELAGK
jgi:hypothetical protein